MSNNQTNLRNGDFKRLYYLDESHPFDFFNTAYKLSNSLRLSLGYFSGTAFGICHDGIIQFLKNNGSIEILCNDKLYIDDVNAIKEGYLNRGNITTNALIMAIQNADDYERFGFQCLRLLIESERLDIRIIKSNELVHYKLGFFRDIDGNELMFTGSVNYTISGLLYNKEQLQITKSWNSDEEKNVISDARNKFIRLRNNEIDKQTVIKPEDVIETLIEYVDLRNIEELEQEYRNVRKKVEFITNQSAELLPKFFEFEAEYTPRFYQVEAIEHWVESDYKSIFAMATGTGKTLTSLFAINSLYCSTQDICTVLILVPLKDLVGQWRSEFENIFGGTIISISSENSNWRRQLERSFILSRKPRGRKTTIICTYRSFGLHFDFIMSNLNTNRTVMVADEVHKYGSKSLLNKMPDQIEYRLGLSATPIREYDDTGSASILNYFSPDSDPFEISIKMAIELGVLTPYRYVPIICYLNDIEMDEYAALSSRIRVLSSGVQSSSDNEDVQKLLKQRHRIIEQAEGKKEKMVDLLDQLVDENIDIHKSVFYVPEGKKGDDSLIDEYIEIITNHTSLRIAKYVMDSSADTLIDFKKGYIDAIAAKKKMDEGINIPEIRIAFFLASSTVEREFIQRRGRILRTSPGKTYAEIYDFLVLPIYSPETDFSYSNYKSVLKSEYKRALLFVDAAMNRHDALKTLDAHFDII